MSSHPSTSTGTETQKIWDSLQRQAAAGAVQPETISQLRRAVEQAEQAAQAEVDAARAEAAATRAEADKAVKALAESEQRYRYMGETIPFGVWWCNPKGEAEYVSPSFCELLDMTLEEQNKFGWTQRLVPEDVEPMMKHWMYCCETGTPWDHEHRIIDRYGKINTVLSRGLPVRDDKGEIIAWVGVNLDITARKQIELQLQEAKEALEQALHIKDQFLANISHELRTPLTLILGPVRKLLAADNLTEEQRHDLAVVERNAGTLLKNVNDLLDLSKLDAGRIRAEYGETDLAWLARFVASHFESVAAERGITFSVEAPESLPGQVDPEKIQRALFNLLANAFKFTPAQGAVRFSLESENDKAVFTVEDTGPGIPVEMHEAIFERFRQVDSSATRRYGGTGLGLAIVKEFVRLHGGSVKAAEAPGGGSRFTVQIPLAAPAGAEVKAAGAITDPEPARSVVAEVHAGAGPTVRPSQPVSADAPLVLVVEDNPEMNAFVAEALGNHFRVAMALDGQEGLDRALNLRPDLIISDIMMPRLSGEELVCEVRSRREMDDIPILLLTAKADENLRVELLSKGAQDCLVKPFVTEELVARAEGLVSRKRKAEARLRESYALLHALTEGITDAVFVKDDQGRYLMINSAGARRLGKAMEEILGYDDTALFDFETAARIRAVDAQVISEGQTITFEETRTVAGDTRTYLTTKGPHRDNQGRIIGVLGISHDITERKQAEEERERLLQEADVQRARLQAILDSLPVGVWIADTTGKMVTVNEIAREIWGGKAPYAEQVAGYQEYKAWWEETGKLITAEEMPLARAIRGETVAGKIVDIERFDGTRGVQLISAAPVQDREGKLIGGVAIVQDITRLKQAEAALRQALAEAEEQRQTLHAMMEHIPMGITIADAPDVTIRAVSRYGRALTGKSREQLEGIPVDLHAERWQIYRADGVTPAENEDLPLTRATQQGEIVREEEWVLGRGDGIRIPILCTAAPIRNAQDHITGGVIGWQDITERKRDEEELRQLKNELEIRVEQRTAELAAANRELEAFGYTVSHDLRAPLRHIMTFIELLDQDIGPNLDEQSRGFMRIISEAAQRMSALIEDMLKLSRLGRVAMAESSVDLQRLVDEARQELATETAGRAIEWEIGPMPEVRGDPTLLRAAVVNLLANAIKYSRGRSPARIEVGSREENGEWICFVRDNGAGFDMKFVNKLFGVFQRLHPAEAFEGTGIGLASVRRIIERHGGRTWAEGEVDRGATFYFSLPEGK